PPLALVPVKAQRGQHVGDGRAHRIGIGTQFGGLAGQVHQCAPPIALHRRLDTRYGVKPRRTFSPHPSADVLRRTALPVAVRAVVIGTIPALFPAHLAPHVYPAPLVPRYLLYFPCFHRGCAFPRGDVPPCIRQRVRPTTTWFWQKEPSRVLA